MVRPSEVTHVSHAAALTLLRRTPMPEVIESSLFTAMPNEPS